MTVDQPDPRPVAVLVVTWNSAAVLPGFVASLTAGMAGVGWRLVVADNDSADGTVAAARDYAPGATVIEAASNLGFAAACNRGAEAAKPLSCVNAEISSQHSVFHSANPSRLHILAVVKNDGGRSGGRLHMKKVRALRVLEHEGGARVGWYQHGQPREGFRRWRG